MTSRPAWMFKLVDFSGKWGFTKDQFIEDILPKLQEFEGLTWGEIQQQCGGRSHGTNSHEIPISSLCPEAKKYFEDKYPDYTEIFSLRFTGTHRLFGIRDYNVLKIIWYDTNHEICPMLG
jgi:hypothetical protein